jgi:hypothetical protein
MQTRRSRAVWFIAIAIAFFFILDPFRLFQQDNVPRMRVNRDIERQMTEFLTASPEAAEYVAGLFHDHDLVLIGETGYVREQLEFLAELIPVLDEAGIRHLGFQYANRDDQERIDALVTASSFDERLANEILFSHMAIMGYEEHRDVFRAAWEVNRAKAAGDTPFRIIGISRPPDYTHIREEGDADDPAILQQAFARGVPDAVMAQTILERIVEAGHKGVAYMRNEHAYTRFVQDQYTTRMEERGFPGQQRAGNMLADRLGDRVKAVLFHTPLQDTRSRFGFGYPVGGVVDNAKKSIPDGRRPGFTVAESPYAEAPITSDVITEHVEGDLQFQTFTDGYLLINTLAQYRAVTPIPGFITEENLQRARTMFPGPDPGEVTVEDMNEFISGMAASMAQIFEKFK